MHRGISKTISGIILLLIIVGIVAGVYMYQSGGGGKQQSSSSSPSQTATAATKDTLVIAMGTDIVTFDLHDASDNPSYMVGRMIYEYLVDLDQNMKIKPGLATSWDIK
ncbi:MAG: hypothetical protein GSR83_03485, partial [Desulfurococcales archaeon]|nr:hypothetical protein [Desulfurococcales archaeon]